MPALVNYRGDDDFHSGGGSLCSGDSGLVFSIKSSHVDIICSPPRKRSRITGPFIFNANNYSLNDQNTPTIDILPDECLFEIFRHLPGGNERSASACVSKRWLSVLSTARTSDFLTDKSSSEKNEKNEDTNLEMECSSDGYLTRTVEGKKATDLRLAAIAVGTSSRGGLGKLSIRGSNVKRGVSNRGLSAIARGCPSLRVLSLWNVPNIGDEGLLEIARECKSLEKLDLCQCPSISNKGLTAIAENSPNLTSLTIESCPNIGNESLQAIAKNCPKLNSVTIKDCPMIGDRGIASLVSSISVLTKVKLQNLNISDSSVAVIGHYGKAITTLVLTGLQYVSQKGFWVMGSTRGLEKLSSLNITSCKGITDLSFEALGKGCPGLKHVSLRKCCFVSDKGLAAFAKSSGSLESMHLEECNRFTQIGILNAISNSSSKLKSVSLVKCMGIKDLSSVQFPILSPCKSLRSLSIRSCPGFGSTSLAMVGQLCPNLHHLDLSGLCGITDAGLLPLLESCTNGLVKVNLSACSNLTDVIVLALSRLHGGTLEVLNLDGCKNITDFSLTTLAENCPMLNDLDVSKCSITDCGVVALSCGVQHNMQILSLSGCSMVSNKSTAALRMLGRTLVGLNLQHCHSISTTMIEMLTEDLWRCDILS